MNYWGFYDCLSAQNANLQEWTTTQLANVPTLAGDNVFTGSTNTFSRVIFKTAQHVQVEQPNIFLDRSTYAKGDTVSNSYYSSIYFRDKNNERLTDITDTIRADGCHVFNISPYSVNGNNTNAYLSFYSDSPTEGNIVCVPTIADLSSNTTAIVNTSFLNNTGNSVVHKTGDETIRGTKTFTNVVQIKGTQPHIEMYKTATDKTFSTQWINPYNILIKNNDETAIRIASCQYNILPDEGTLYATFWNNALDKDFNIIGKSTFESHIFTKDDIVYNEFLVRLGDDNIVHFAVSDEFNSIAPGIALSNQISCGHALAKWSQVYAGNGTIQTSDENLKTEIGNIPESVMRAWGKVKFQQFKFKDAVEKKGANARIHIGAIAQRVMEAFQSEGLDAKRYGLFCLDSWEDQYEDVKVVDKEAVIGDVKVVDSQAIYEPIYNENMEEIGQKEISPEKFHYEKQEISPEVNHTEKRLIKAAGEQYSLRYEQCLCLECAYQRWLGEQREARLAALEAKLTNQ